MKWVIEATQAKYKQSVAVMHKMTNSKEKKEMKEWVAGQPSDLKALKALLSVF